MLDYAYNLHTMYEESFFGTEYISMYCCKYFVNCVNLLVSAVEETPVIDIINYTLNLLNSITDDLLEQCLGYSIFLDLYSAVTPIEVDFFEYFNYS